MNSLYLYNFICVSPHICGLRLQSVNNRFIAAYIQVINSACERDLSITNILLLTL